MRIALAMAPALLLLAAPAAVPIAPAGDKAPSDLDQLVRGNNAFGRDLYGRLCKEKGNLFFSPYSISDALAMTYAGARGKTAEQMARTLHFDLPEQRLHPAFGKLITHLTGSDYQLRMVNALWRQKGFAFQPGFVNVARGRYAAGLEEVDFERAPEQAREQINKWVYIQTREKISDLIPPGAIDEKTSLVLANAIYFKAGWETAFDKNQTRYETFTLPDGKERVPVQMMHGWFANAGYMQGKGFQALELPFKYREVSMLLLLPERADGLAEFEAQLAQDKEPQWLGKLRPAASGEVSLPRFKVESGFSLNDTLKQMGMPLAFSPGADFSGIGKEFGWIGAVFHKAYVKVDEQGVEAAGGTADSGVRGSVPHFRADHPFLFLIRENSTKSILFIGRVNHPAVFKE